MATPALTLQLSSCQNNNCKTLTLTDTSLDYTVVPNLTWNDVGESVLTDISAASLSITLTSDISQTYILDILGFFSKLYIGRIYGVLGSNIVTGVNTSFSTTVSPGDNIAIGLLNNQYTVLTVDSDTQLTLSSILTIAATYDWSFNMNTTTGLPANLIFDIISDDLGISHDVSLPDGVYNIVYSITDGNLQCTYTFETNILLYCQAECCVQNKVRQIPNYYQCSNCDSSFIDNALLSYAFLISLKSSANCGSANELSNILNTLKKICNYQSCIGCK